MLSTSAITDCGGLGSGIKLSIAFTMRTAVHGFLRSAFKCDWGFKGFLAVVNKEKLCCRRGGAASLISEISAMMRNIISVNKRNTCVLSSAGTIGCGLGARALRYDLRAVVNLRKSYCKHDKRKNQRKFRQTAKIWYSRQLLARCDKHQIWRVNVWQRL